MNIIKFKQLLLTALEYLQVILLLFFFTAILSFLFNPFYIGGLASCWFDTFMEGFESKLDAKYYSK